MPVKRIGFIGYNGVTAIDLFGPIEVFDRAKGCAQGSDVSYEILVLTASGEPFTLEQGIRVTPHGSLRDALPLDTIIVPGGAGSRRSDARQPVIEWLQHNAAHIRRIGSVCIGIYVLAEAGLLDGRRATTHWRCAQDVGKEYPKIRLLADSIYERDGKYYTSAGMTAGIDLSLSLVEEDLGAAAALCVARKMVVYLKRPGGQMQFSEPLQFQTKAIDSFSSLADWILRNLRGDLSVEALAEQSRLGPRQFSRRFKATFGIPPAEYVEKLRLDEARRRLAIGKQSVERTATAVGYASGDAFRRAFERQFGISPSGYRRQFSATTRVSGPESDA